MKLESHSLWDTTFQTLPQISSVLLLLDILLQETNAGPSSFKTTANTHFVGIGPLLPPLCPPQDWNTFRISIFHCKTKFCLFFVALFVVYSVCFVSVAVVGLSTFLFTTSSKRIVLHFLCHHVDHPIFHTFFFTFPDLSSAANDILGDL